jgi:hypothetical protein
MKNIKTFAKFNETANNNTIDVYSLDINQFYYLIDFLESDIEMYDSRDFQHYEDETSLDISDLMDMYIGYGYNTRGYEETKKMKDNYCRIHNTTWNDIVSEHDK